VRLVDEPTPAGRPGFVRPRGRLVLLGLVAFCAFLLDGAANHWSAVNLRSEHHAGAGLAAAGFGVYALSVALVRVAGDRLIARLGRARAVQLGGLAAAAGAGGIVIAPGVLAALAGWAVLGAGSAIIAPAVIGAAPAAGNAPTGIAIASVTTLGYLGSFTGPPLIGALAQISDLSTALLLPAVAAGAIVALSRFALTPACGRRAGAGSGSR